MHTCLLELVGPLRHLCYAAIAQRDKRTLSAQLALQPHTVCPVFNVNHTIRIRTSSPRTLRLKALQNFHFLLPGIEMAGAHLSPFDVGRDEQASQASKRQQRAVPCRSTRCTAHAAAQSISGAIHEQQQHRRRCRVRRSN